MNISHTLTPETRREKKVLLVLKLLNIHSAESEEDIGLNFIHLSNIHGQFIWAAD